MQPPTFHNFKRNCFVPVYTADNPSASCPICLRRYGIYSTPNPHNDVPSENPVKIFPCQHIFGSDCFNSWLNEGKSTCPMCRHILYETPTPPDSGGESDEYEDEDEEANDRLLERQPPQPQHGNDSRQYWGAIDELELMVYYPDYELGGPYPEINPAQSAQEHLTEATAEADKYASAVELAFSCERRREMRRVKLETTKKGDQNDKLRAALDVDNAYIDPPGDCLVDPNPGELDSVSQRRVADIEILARQSWENTYIDVDADSMIKTLPVLRRLLSYYYPVAQSGIADHAHDCLKAVLEMSARRRARALAVFELLHQEARKAYLVHLYTEDDNWKAEHFRESEHIVNGMPNYLIKLVMYMVEWQRYRKLRRERHRLKANWHNAEA